MKVSVIATVFNEREAIERLLQSLEAQSRRPDEVVITDGGSTDGTLDTLSAWVASGRLPLRAFKKSGANISEGRNAAIAMATSDVIAVTDAGVWLEDGWLEALVAPFEAQSSFPFVAAVAGWFVADPQNAWTGSEAQRAELSEWIRKQGDCREHDHNGTEKGRCNTMIALHFTIILCLPML